MRPLLFLKATVKKMIQVPGYYRKDGTYVPPHQKIVHYDPDKEVSHVLEGKGSHSQKKALKQVKGKVKDFDSLPADHKFAIILSHATDIQEKASHAAAISGWKKKALSGKNPTPAQWAAFQKLNPVQRDQMLFLVKEKVGSVDHLDIPESEPEKPAEDGASKKDAEAAAFMEALAKGEGKHYELKAYKKMLVDEKFKSLAPHAQADAVKIMAADMQKAASASAAISMMKKKLLAGKSPTPAQLKAYEGLDDKKKEAFMLWANEAGVFPAFWTKYEAWKKGGKAKTGDDDKPAPAQKADKGFDGTVFAPGVKVGDHILHDKVGTLPHGSVVEVVYGDGSRETVYVADTKYGPVFYSWDGKGEQVHLHLGIGHNYDAIKVVSIGSPGKVLPWQLNVLKEKLPNGGYVMSLNGTIVSPHFVSKELKKVGKVGVITLDGGFAEIPASMVNDALEDGAPMLHAQYVSGDDMLEVSEGTIIQKNGHTYKLKGGRWHRVDQDVPSLDKKANKLKQQAQDDQDVSVKEVDGLPVVDISGWKQVDGQKGSNPGGLYEAPNGMRFYVKFPKKADPRNELLASKLYALAGIDVPVAGLVEKGGKLGIASVWRDDLKQADASKLAQAPGAHDGFVFDAWLANWDVAGTGYDNMLLDKDGRAVRIDPGGALLYRAQGEPKGDAFGPEVPELESLLDSKVNAYAASVFDGIDDKTLKKGARRLAQISPEIIDELVAAEGPGSAKDKKRMAKILKSRRAYILKHLGVPDPFAKGGGSGKAVVFEEDLPSPPDFSNWHGKGSGLSSKDWVNKSNDAAVQAIWEAGLSGDIEALEKLKVPVLDESGKQADMVLASDHISKHVRAYHKHVLDTVKGLSKAVVKMPVLGLDALFVQLSKVTGFYPHGITTSDVSHDKVLGYFLRLSPAPEALNLVPEGHYLSKKDAFIQSGYDWYGSLPNAMKNIIEKVQSSGSINHIFSSKSPATISKKKRSPSEVSLLMHKHAVELEEGMIIQRGMTMSESAAKDLVNLNPGDALQNTDSMCCSYNKKHKWSGNIWLRITCAKGAKVLLSYGSGNYASEHEITTLPGARFIVKEKPTMVAGRVFVDLVMLPPDDGYLATIEEAAQIGDLHKSDRVVLVFFAGGFKYGKQG